MIWKNSSALKSMAPCLKGKDYSATSSTRQSFRLLLHNRDQCLCFTSRDIFYLPSGNQWKLPSSLLRVLRKVDVYELLNDKCSKNADGETC